jgi:fermentation-respiration switch protein FrsA (DUF1100 family)
LLSFFENRLVYYPVPARSDWRPKPADDVQDVTMMSADGTEIHGWWWPQPGSRGAILYLHGKAGNLSHRGESIKELRDLLGESILIIDYPGYGRSGGRVSEAGCYAAADAAHDFLVKQNIEPERIILYGGSLGGGVAVDLAARKQKYHAVILVKTFTSLPDVGRRQFPWLPVRWLMRNRMDNLSKIGKLKGPVFIAHGTADELVPFDHGKALFDAANEPKEFFEDICDHNSPFGEAFHTRLKAFIQRHRPA